METTDSTRRERHRHGRNGSPEKQRRLRKENKGSHDAASPSCSSSSAPDAPFSPSAGRERLRPNSPGRNGLHNKRETERKRRRHSDSGFRSRSSSPRYGPCSPGGEEEKSARRRHEYRDSPQRQRRSSRSRSSSQPKGKKGVQKKERSESPGTSEHRSCAFPSSHSPRSSESRPASVERNIPSSARKEKQRHSSRGCSGSSSSSTRRSSNSSTILAGGAASCGDVAFDENADQAAAASPQMEQGENSFSGSSVCMPSAFLRREKRRGGFGGGLSRLKALRHEEDFMYADFTIAGQREAAASTLLPEGASAAEVAAADTSSAVETRAAAAGAKSSTEEHQEQPRLPAEEKAAAAVRKRAIMMAKDGAEVAPTERPATAAAAGRRYAAESCASVSNEGGAGSGTSDGAAPSLLQQQQQRQRSLHLKGGEQQQQGGTQGEGNGGGISGKEKEGDEDEVLLEVEEEEEAAEVVRSMRELQKARQTRWIRKGLDVRSMEEKEKAAAAVEEEDELAGYGLLEKSFSAVSNAAGLTYDKHLYVRRCSSQKRRHEEAEAATEAAAAATKAAATEATATDAAAVEAAAIEAAATEAAATEAAATEAAEKRSPRGATATEQAETYAEEFLRERMQLKEVQSNSTPAQQEQEGAGQQTNVMPSTEDLYKIPEHLQVPDRSNDLREQLNWLTGLTEVPLPLSAKLKNIEATEKAKRALLKKGNTGETLDDEDDPDVVRRKAFGLRYTWFDPDRRQRVSQFTFL